MASQSARSERFLDGGIVHRLHSALAVRRSAGRSLLRAVADASRRARVRST